MCQLEVQAWLQAAGETCKHNPQGALRPRNPAVDEAGLIVPASLPPADDALPTRPSQNRLRSTYSALPLSAWPTNVARAARPLEKPGSAQAACRAMGDLGVGFGKRLVGVVMGLNQGDGLCCCATPVARELGTTPSSTHPFSHLVRSAFPSASSKCRDAPSANLATL